MSSINEATIATVRDLQKKVKERRNNASVVEFQLADLDFDNGIFYKDIKISNNAISKINSTLQIKDKFLTRHKNRIEVEEWDNMKNALKHSVGGTKFYGKKIINNAGEEEIVKIYDGSRKDDTDGIIHSGSNITYDYYFDTLVDILSGCVEDYSISNASYDNEHETVRISLLDTNSEFDVFQNGLDPWKVGWDMSFDALQYQQSPFFERLICTNGMVSAEHGSSTNIQAKRFNRATINRLMEKILAPEYSDFFNLIQSASLNAKNYDLSIKEFNMFKSFFVDNNVNNRYDKLISRFFDDKDILIAYKDCDSKLMKTSAWQSTASSGRNVYDFFNDMTWIASHRDRSGLDLNDTRQLQIIAGKFLLSQPDMSKIAPHVNFRVPSKAPVNGQSF